eukprot:TRINITY_DN5504_c0_g1_i1.p1 TRINITY_DN5504_c0_g1~~TRINITY_DN5504_c0_g1_i1.p1  ORF type:complete len:535 (-),score=129.34 TRINITY_DN5504_c0_g1_i1:62-1612(-)
MSRCGKPLLVAAFALHMLFADALRQSGGFLRTNPATSMIEDEAGRERFFHGVNVVYKGPPYVPDTSKFDVYLSYCETDIQTLAYFGMNVIRLGTMWPGAEPVQGSFNETYFDQLKWIVDNSAAAGIYSVLDMHQDVLSERFCGEGAPNWAMIPNPLFPFPEPIDRRFAVDPQTEWPSAADCNKHSWASYYSTSAASTSFQNIYSNTDGIGDAFSNFWLKVATEFHNRSSVIAYELMNEPWAGNIFADPALMIPQVADVKNLQPTWNRTAAVIRTVDDKHIIMFAAVTWDDANVGFTDVPGGAEYRNRSVLAYHYYIPPQLAMAPYFAARHQDITRLQCGGFVTEFGIGYPLDNHKYAPMAREDFVGFDDTMTATMDIMDKYLQSWIGWEYKQFIPITGFGNSFWNADGSINWPIARTMSRTYAPAVAGHTLSMSYNNITAAFVLQYAVNAAATLPTEIYLCEKVHYPNGYDVVISPMGAAVWQRLEENLLSVTAYPTTAQDTVVTVSITARRSSAD